MVWQQNAKHERNMKTKLLLYMVLAFGLLYYLLSLMLMKGHFLFTSNNGIFKTKNESEKVGYLINQAKYDIISEGRPILETFQHAEFWIEEYHYSQHLGFLISFPSYNKSTYRFNFVISKYPNDSFDYLYKIDNGEEYFGVLNDCNANATFNKNNKYVIIDFFRINDSITKVNTVKINLKKFD